MFTKAFRRGILPTKKHSMMRRKTIHMRNLLLIALIVSLVSGCPANPPTPTGDSTASSIDGYLRDIPHLPQVPAIAPRKTAEGTPTDAGIIDRRRRLCQTDKYTETNNFQEIAALDPNSASTYPGALVEGKNLSSGRFTEI